MTLLQIYFIIAGIILLSKFLFKLFTFNYLKRFISANKKTIDELLIDEHKLDRIKKQAAYLIKVSSLTYSDLIIYHFSTNSIKYEDYSDEMSAFLINGSCFEIILYILFALFWVISIPCVLLCMLIGSFSEKFEKFSKNILS
jgi:hypothetical protein